MIIRGAPKHYNYDNVKLEIVFYRTIIFSNIILLES